MQMTTAPDCISRRVNRFMGLLAAALISLEEAYLTLRDNLLSPQRLKTTPKPV